MRDRSFGRVINISSINGQKGQMGQANCSAAKAGDPLGFTKALARGRRRQEYHRQRHLPRLHRHGDGAWRCREKVLKERIIPQIPVGRLGDPEEIARIRGLPCSVDDAGFITGSTIQCHGGQFFSQFEMAVMLRLISAETPAIIASPISLVAVCRGFEFQSDRRSESVNASHFTFPASVRHLAQRDKRWIARQEPALRCLR